MDASFEQPVISPDGTKIVYVENDHLWLKEMDQAEPKEIPDTQGGRNPFWSPESEEVGYSVEGTLWKATLSGNARTRLGDLPGNGYPLGISWSSHGDILFSIFTLAGMPLLTMSDQGGSVHPFIQSDSSRNEFGIMSPYVLPDGQSLMYAVWMRGDSATVQGLSDRATPVYPTMATGMRMGRVGSSEIVVHSADGVRRTLPFPGDWVASPVYSATGHLLYFSGLPSDLWAAPFSLSSLEVTGDPFVVVQNISDFSVSDDGTLVYRNRVGVSGRQQLVWADRKGNVEGIIGQPQASMKDVALSPDGTRVAVQALEQGNRDIWIHDIGRGTKTRLTFDPAIDNSPVWSPQSDRIAFGSWRGIQSDIFLRQADGTGEAEMIEAGPNHAVPHDWSPNGQTLVYTVADFSINNWDIWSMSLDGDKAPSPFQEDTFRMGQGQFSPDGKYLAYMSERSGQPEVYVTRWPSGDGLWQVSVNGGIYPRWKGSEIFYVEFQATPVVTTVLMAAPVEMTASAPHIGTPQPLFSRVGVERLAGGNADGRWYDITADGQRFVVLQAEQQDRQDRR